jgi:hypothetical protein
MKLFEACVQPILLYCSEVWSLPQLFKSKDITNFESNYEKVVPNRIQVKYSKYVLGVHKSATNIAILGELGLYPLSLNAFKSSVGYLLHILNVKDNNLIFHSYKDNLLIKDGLFIKLKCFFLEVIGFGHIWDNQATFSKLRTLSAIADKLQNKYFDFWHKLLFNDNRVIGGVTKMPMDTCIHTRKIIKCSVLIDSYLHHVYFHAKDYFTKRRSTLPFGSIYVMGIEAFICIYGKLLFPKQYVHPFFGEPENNLFSLEQ